jgi:type IV pilus assembly protein PilA
MRRARGFTLTEMGVTIVIIGILATLGIMGYRKLVASSRINEPVKMVVSIGVAQEDFNGKRMGYANISPNLDTTYPAAAPKAFRTAWGAACGSQCNAGMDWSMLNLKVDDPVMFGYATIAGFALSAPNPKSITVGSNTVTFPDPPQTNWWIVAATGDTDDDGNKARVYTTSFRTNQVFVDKEGE